MSILNGVLQNRAFERVEMEVLVDKIAATGFWALFSSRICKLQEKVIFGGLK